MLSYFPVFVEVTDRCVDNGSYLFPLTYSVSPSYDRSTAAILIGNYTKYFLSHFPFSLVQSNA
jgi:hypothetical protein